MRKKSKLLQGTVDVLILRALDPGPLHGYGIARWLEERTDGVLGLDDAALYQALHRLEARELVTADWGLTDTNRRAKFYSLTATGRQQALAEAGAWRDYAEAVLKVLDTP